MHKKIFLEQYSLANNKVYFLTFLIHGKKCAVPINRIRAVRDVKNFIVSVKGVGRIVGMIDFNNKNIPIVDVWSEFNSVFDGIPRKACLVFIRSNGFIIGVIADDMPCIHSFSNTEIENSRAQGRHFKSSYISGLIRGKDDVIMLIDADKLFPNQVVKKVIADLSVVK